MLIALGTEKCDETIVNACRNFNITAADAARCYGTEGHLRHFKGTVVTKVPKGGNVLESYKESAKAMGRNMWHGLIMHHSSDYNMDNYSDLKICKIAGYVKKIGVSVYDVEDIPYSLPFDILQFPLSVIDQRFVKEIPTLKSRGVELWCRSTLMKGVLLQNPDKLPPFFDPIKLKLCQLPKNPAARINLCLQFVRELGIDYCVLGFENPLQMKEIVECIGQNSFSEYSSNNCTDYRNWKL